MDTIKKRTTLVGVGTLIVGLALGLAIGVWGSKTTQASNAPAMKSSPKVAAKADAQNPDSARSDTWDPFREMERMQEEIDRAVRHATEQIQLGPNATLFRPDAGYSSTFDLRD